MLGEEISTERYIHIYCSNLFNPFDSYSKVKKRGHHWATPVSNKNFIMKMLF